MAGNRKPPSNPRLFQKGVSGNPGGRPKALIHVRDLAREYTEKAIRTLVDCLDDPNSNSVRVQAAQALLDRGWGKPTQPISGEDGNAIPVSISTEERLLDKLDRLAGVVGKASDDADANEDEDDEV